jgi:hypothetical protein
VLRRKIKTELNRSIRKKNEVRRHSKCLGRGYLRVKGEAVQLEPREEVALDALDELQVISRDRHLRFGFGLGSGRA